MGLQHCKMLNFDKLEKQRKKFNNKVLLDAQLQSISILYFFPKSMTLFGVSSCVSFEF